MVRFRRIGLAGLLLLAACGQGDPAAAPDESPALTNAQFIEVYTALREAAREAPDSLAFDSMRMEILDRYEVTERDLFEFAQTNGADIPAMAEIWDTIAGRLTIPDSLQEPD
ncbi:MAG TPA: hypothetical protein VF212_09125 [Longimicrobiales bacterium]